MHGRKGEQTIAHVAGRNEGRRIEWHNVTGDRAALAGESKNMTVPDEGVWSIRIAIDQVGEADRLPRRQYSGVVTETSLRKCRRASSWPATAGNLHHEASDSRTRGRPIRADCVRTATGGQT